MDNIELDKIIVRSDSGEEREAEVLKVVSIGDKNYVVYTFDPEAENVDLYASLMLEKDGVISFMPVETAEEWDAIGKEISALAL